MGLSSTTDELDNRLGLGAALGGMILLAIAGSLPEIASRSRRRARQLGLAAGNLIGGIADLTLVLVVCDAALERPLTFLAAPSRREGLARFVAARCAGALLRRAMRWPATASIATSPPGLPAVGPNPSSATPAGGRAARAGPARPLVREAAPRRPRAGPRSSSPRFHGRVPRRADRAAGWRARGAGNGVIFGATVLALPPPCPRSRPVAGWSATTSSTAGQRSGNFQPLPGRGRRAAGAAHGGASCAARRPRDHPHRDGVMPLVGALPG